MWHNLCLFRENMVFQSVSIIKKPMWRTWSLILVRVTISSSDKSSYPKAHSIIELKIILFVSVYQMEPVSSFEAWFERTRSKIRRRGPHFSSVDSLLRQPVGCPARTVRDICYHSFYTYFYCAGFRTDFLACQKSVDKTRKLRWDFRICQAWISCWWLCRERDCIST